MASIANPLLVNSNYASLLPGRNPTGGPLSSIGDGGVGSGSGANPILTPPNIPSGAPATNPYAPGSVIPSFGANSGAYTSSSLTGGASPSGSTALSPLGTGPGLSGMTQSGLNDMYHELNKTYGEGTASAIMNFLSSGAGFNQNAINNIFAALQPGINRGTENLMQQFSTSGNRFGSGAQIGLADYLSQVNLNEGSIETQMYEDSISNYINTLMGVANKNSTRIANSPSLFEQITSPITDLTGQSIGSLLGQGAQAGSAAASASNPAADTGILDAIAAIGLCWVAAELYGGWFAPQTIAIRNWLLSTWYMQPFVALYKKYGKRWAKLIQRNVLARTWTKKLFDGFLEASR